jgi:hypothetical protein
MTTESESARATVVRLGVSVPVQDATGAPLLDLRRDCGRWGMLGDRVGVVESVADVHWRFRRKTTNGKPAGSIQASVANPSPDFDPPSFCE